MRDSEGPTYTGTMRELGGSRKRSLTIRLLRFFDGVAMTVLDCAKCKWRIHLEAHHDYGRGRPRRLNPRRFRSKKEYNRYKAWRTKMFPQEDEVSEVWLPGVSLRAHRRHEPRPVVGTVLARAGMTWLPG